MDIKKITTPKGTVRLIARTPKVGRVYNAKPRMYVGTDEAFNLLEDLENRTRRPYTVWRNAARELVAEAGIRLDLTKMHWSQFAGCSCPCSPGFILGAQTVLDDDNNPHTAFDVHVTLTGAPAVDETKPARELVAA